MSGEDVGFEALLVRLASLFVDATADTVDDAIQRTLEGTARSHAVDRANVWLADPVNGLFRATHHWAKAAERTPYESRSVAFAEFAWSGGVLSRGEVIAYRRSDLPPEAVTERAALEATGALVIAILPLRASGALLGCVTCERTEHDVPWTPTSLAHFGLVATIIANAVHRQRLEASAAEVARFDHLVAEVAAGLVVRDAGGLDLALERALAQIGEATDVDRAFVHEWNLDTREATVRARWSRDEHAPALAGPLPLDAFPYWRARDREPFVLPRVADLPPEAATERALLERAGVRSQLLVPIRAGETTLGTLGLDTCRHERTWSAELVARARTLGEVFANAIARERAETAEREAHAEVARLQQVLQRERDYLRDEIRSEHHVDEIVAVSAELVEVLATVDAVATTNTTVLVSGETGVGKEVVARAIHARSRRVSAPLVKIDCASMPRDAFEREFFGHAAGAWPGAREERIGRFELADRGTLLLDEVGEIPLELQSKLLRLLSDGEIRRVGDATARRLDVRVIATTNRDLGQEVDAGRFRSDLYFRLRAFPIVVPPLRERLDDIVPLARSFLRRAQLNVGRPELTLDAAAERTLRQYPWPGNARELQHVVERAVILSPAPPLRLDLAFGARSKSGSAFDSGGIRTAAELRELERRNIVRALEQASHRVAGAGGAAELLGMSPSTLRDRMIAFGIGSKRARR